jgi:hypothetical protein
MSVDLLDEIEVVNSIYGEETLAPLAGGPPSTYILHLPDASSALQLQFPGAYPTEPPAIIATYSSGDGAHRGNAAHDLELFREAVGIVFQPGQVCVFDAIEKFGELAAATQPPDQDRKDRERASTSAQKDEFPQKLTGSEPNVESRSAVILDTEPVWTVSDPFIESKSTFIARCAPVTSPAEAASFLQHLLASDKKVRVATHNITAWRIHGTNGTTYQDCDDDGETAAGGRLLHLMQLMELWGVMVVVTRWYGGQKLGPRRFALINQAARDAFVKAMLVPEAPSGKKKAHGR